MTGVLVSRKKPLSIKIEVRREAGLDLIRSKSTIYVSPEKTGFLTLCIGKLSLHFCLVIERIQPLTIRGNRSSRGSFYSLNNLIFDVVEKFKVVFFPAAAFFIANWFVPWADVHPDRGRFSHSRSSAVSFYRALFIESSPPDPMRSVT